MLVNCVVYQDGKKLADIAQREIPDYLARPGCFVWVALREATDAELDEISRQFELHELAVEDARRMDSPRATPPERPVPRRIRRPPSTSTTATHLPTRRPRLRSVRRTRNCSSS
jgi:hypothetical protein